MFTWRKLGEKPTENTEIEELRIKLRDTEAKLSKLSEEMEQGYIKDKLENNKGVQLEYIERLGEISVKYYDFSFHYQPFFGPSYTRTMTHHWGKGYCEKLRDFLVKNFPIEAKGAIDTEEEEANENNV